MSELLNDDHEDKYWISVSAQDPGSLLRRSAPLLRDAGQRGVQALSVLLLCCTCPSSAVLVLLVLYFFVWYCTCVCIALLGCVVLYLSVQCCAYSCCPLLCRAVLLLCCTCLCSAVLIRVVLIPDIYQFWYITALYRPVKSTPKISRQNSKITLSLCKKSTLA